MNSPAGSAQIVRNAAALVIGTELLSGKIRDENLFRLSQCLRALGIELGRVIFCPDDRATIVRDVRELTAMFDVVFTSGGVGPTHDDVTIEAIAEAQGKTVTESPELRAAIEKLYGKKTSAAHLLMARVPSGAELIESASARWPTIVSERVWVLPGVPELFHSKLMVVREHLRGPHAFFTEIVHCSAEEADVKDILDDVVKAHPQCEIGSYPKWFEPRYKTRFTIDARDSNVARAAAERLRERLGTLVVTFE